MSGRWLVVGLIVAGGAGVGLICASGRRQQPGVQESGAQVLVTDSELTRLTQDQPSGRTAFLDAGLSLDIPDGLVARLTESGIQRFIRVVDPRGNSQKPVLMINSGPAYPWLDADALRQVAQGGWKEWRSGAITLPDLEMEVPWPGTWAYEAAPQRRLVAVAEGRISLITATDWSDPRFRRLLGSLQPAKGGDYRSAYLRVGRAPAGSAGAPPPKELVEDVEKSLRLVEAGVPTLPPTVVQGAAAWRAKKLDQLDAMIFLDVLRPILADLEQEAMSNAVREGEHCPVQPSPPMAPQGEGQTEGDKK